VGLTKETQGLRDFAVSASFLEILTCKSVPG
jgi:hypothetical protein